MKSRYWTMAAMIGVLLSTLVARPAHAIDIRFPLAVHVVGKLLFVLSTMGH